MTITPFAEDELVEAAACPLPDGDLAAALDTCYKQAEKARQRESWLRMVIDTANDAFVSTNVMGEVLEWNSKSEELFGWSHEEAIGKRLTETIFRQPS